MVNHCREAWLWLDSLCICSLISTSQEQADDASKNRWAMLKFPFKEWASFSTITVYLNPGHWLYAKVTSSGQGKNCRNIRAVWMWQHQHSNLVHIYGMQWKVGMDKSWS